ncbi:TonB-dependent receptor [Hymenobacter sp. H14-R3]|uniref:TonB-dependent receptor domain-containing protein n=1 Tax=Hymenobacter sp. H14-R3 TaxID=3046308 RepID=UPI0024BA0A65|nr:TonB-dependent receptor [Hymenobacter sp. H14-R3]MDJ0366824.1 TonB-dependent receptor [Hymenobacter sp. H14-R3]
MNKNTLPFSGLVAATLLGSPLLSLAQAGGRPAAAAPRSTGRVTGTITDAANGKPVSYATVAVINPVTNSAVNGGVAGDDGKFVLPVPPGTYRVEVSFIGYQTQVKNGVVVTPGGTVALGTVALAAAAQKLGEVIVTGRKPLIEERVDRTIYNADVDKTTAGGDATDVLKRVPLLSVDLDGNVSLRGSSNIRVLINNKPSTIAASSVADALKQIPADQIQTVEVITSPSAKYDGEGSGGIINIITKQNNLRGASLSVNSSAGTRASNLGLSGSVSNGKFGASLGGFGRAQYNTPGSFENVQTSTNLQRGDRTTVQQRAATRQTNAFGRYTLGLTYDFDKQNSLAGSLAYGVRNGKNYQDQLISNTLAGTTTGITSVRDVASTSNSGTVDASLNYTHLYEQKQRELSVLTLFSRNNQTNDFTNNVFEPSDRAYLGQLGNNNQSRNQEITGQVDYQTPTAKDQLLEVGVKDIVRRVTSDYSNFYGPGLAPATPPAPNSFLYQQNVAAGYAAYTMGLPKGFALKPGVRFEYTTITASFSDPNGVLTATNIPNYLKVLPSVNLSRKFENGNVLKLAYNIRIQRPSLQFLNPNVQASNPLNASAGNPVLRPENTQNYELGYSTQIKQKVNLNISTFVRSTNNAIQTVRVPLADSLNPTRAVGALLSTFRNAGTERAYGTNLFVGINNAKMSLNGSMDLFYSVLRNNDTTTIYNSSNQGFVVNGRVFGSYNLNKDWALQAFAFVRGQQVQLQGYQSGFGVYSLSLQRNFAEKRGSFGFGAENFFSNQITIRNSVSTPYVDTYNGVAINGPVLTQNSTNVLNRLSFKVNFSYRIGKLTAGDAGRRRKGVSNDDLKDGGDAGGGLGGGDTGGGQGGAPAGGGGRPSGQGAPGAARPGGYPGAGQRPAGAPAPASATDSTRRAMPAGSPQLLRNQPTLPNGAAGQPTPAPGVAVPADSTTTAPAASPAIKPSSTTSPVGPPSPGTTSPSGITPAGSPGGRP